MIRQWFFGLFYDKQYLQGKWFDNGVAWGWCLRGILYQKILGINRHAPFPISLTSRISENPNIAIHPDDINNFQEPGSYYQCNPGTITIGYGTQIAMGVGIITQNHSKDDPDKHDPAKDIVIGEKCWIGMNAIILPGVTLGNHTTVGAGSVVTKSFPEGHCTIAGNPAKRIT